MPKYAKNDSNRAKMILASANAKVRAKNFYENSEFHMSTTSAPKILG